MNLYTIGFTKKSAKKFFTELKENGVVRLVDVRLNNVSQLAGFAKKEDLKYFLQAICGIEYVHEPLLAPTQDMLDEYRKKGGSWQMYEERFLELMSERKIEDRILPSSIKDGCLLCSEDKPHYCHRRLVANYLNQHWGQIDIKHLD